MKILEKTGVFTINKFVSTELSYHIYATINCIKTAAEISGNMTDKSS